MSVGARLRKARESRGLSVQDVAGVTRIAPHWLTSIERDDPSVFPPGPYGSGFLRAYARELGLPPESTAREFFAQFDSAPAAPERAAPPRALERTAPPLAPAMLTVALLLAIGTWVMWPRADAAPAARESGAVGTSGQQVPAPAAAAPAANPAARDFTIVLEADRRVWVAASADGRRVVYRTLDAGARETIRAERDITLRVGDAGAVRWTVGDRAPAPMGAPGAVRTITVTPETLASVR